MCLDYESLRLPETSIFKWSGYSTLFIRLIIGVLLGVFFFGEVVSFSIFVGPALILLSGLFIGLWSK
jgi:drug/metabolite transporter (DMT)-like permease